GVGCGVWGVGCGVTPYTPHPTPYTKLHAPLAAHQRRRLRADVAERVRVGAIRGRLSPSPHGEDDHGAAADHRERGKEIDEHVDSARLRLEQDELAVSSD